MRGGVLEMSDLAWLNRTSLADETIDFLGRDDRTSWDLLRRAVEDPGGRNVMRSFRTAARGAGAEMVAAGEAEKLGTRVRRQVPMGTSELDFEITSGRRRFGFEVKGWTPDTWEEALDAAILRLNKKGLTEAQRKVVEKIDRMLKQLADAKAATGSMPYLGVTDALSEARLKQLRRILQAEGLGGTTIVPLSEDAIRKAAHVTIGQALGVPLP
jgi:very-short-patch-repair endonuclease